MLLRRPAWLALALCFWMGCDNIPISPQPVVHYSGRVIDSKGRPIPGGYIRFESIKGLASSTFSLEFADIDSTGSFLVDLYAGAYHVRWSPSYSSNVYRDNGAADRSIEVSADHPTLEWVVDGIVVHGGMKDPSGADVDSFGVYASNERYEAGAVTASGQYELFLAPGTYTFYAYGRFGTGVPSQSFGPFSVQSDTALDFQMDGIEITGTVRGPGSALLANALIDGRGESGGATARSDGSGNYKMYLAPQDVRFRIYPAETWILSQLSTSITIATPASVDFNLGGTVWTGIVTRSDTGMPVADATVAAALVADRYERQATAKTDALGQFRLAVDPGREYDLSASSGPLESASVSRVAGADSSFALELVVPNP